MPTATEAPDSALDLLTPERPFPGPKPYVEAWKDYYHGRESELADVAHLIRRGPLAVLFGASGLGKTSLLNAGVLPRLREEDFFPIVVRLDFEQAAIDLVEQVMLGLRTEVERRNQAAQDAADKVTLEKGASRATLWEYFKTVELWSADWQLLTPVVVFDQFEEVFTKGQRTTERRAAVRAFFVALRDLTENHLPDALAGDPRFRRRSGRSDEAPNVRVTLSLREDYLSHLEAYRREMPSVMRDRFWLRPMTRQQAVDTVVKIAPKLLTVDAAKHLVAAIASSQSDATDPSRLDSTGSAQPDETDAEPLEQLEVEPSLLNLFCYQLNEVRREPRNAGRASKGITSTLIDDAKGNIIRDFYADCLKGFDARVRTFVEEKLIAELGYRELVRWEVAVTEPGIDAAILAELENRRLLRRELRSTAAYLELVHDVLVRPIRAARDARRAARFRWRVASVATLVAVSGLGLSYFIVTDTRNEESIIAQALGFTERLEKAKKSLQEVQNISEQLQRERSENQRAVNELKAGIESKKSQLDAAMKELDAAKGELSAETARVEQVGKDLTDIKRALTDEKARLEASKLALERSLLRQREGDARLKELTQKETALMHNQQALERRKAALEYEIRVLNIKAGSPQ